MMAIRIIEIFINLIITPRMFKFNYFKLDDTLTAEGQRNVPTMNFNVNAISKIGKSLKYFTIEVLCKDLTGKYKSTIDLKIKLK